MCVCRKPARKRWLPCFTGVQCEEGLLLLRAGVHSNCIRVLLPLTIQDAELEEALDAWERALERTLA